MALSTNNQALAEFGRNAGMDNPDSAWLLSDWDIWVANPSYRGPAVPHPEADEDYEGACDRPRPPAFWGADGSDDLPF